MNILTISNITYCVNNENILNNISFEVEKGDCISIIGKSGSGKSTMLKIIADLLPITRGDIFYNGISYNNYDPIKLRKEISYCMQTPQLFGHKVFDNFIFPYKIRKESVDKNKIFKLIKDFNLEKDILDKNINTLSGGEKQKISIIRNLLFTPKIILLDESTSALDDENTTIVENIIKTFNNQGVTVLWITHDINQSKKIFNKRICFEKNQIEKTEVLF